MKWVCMDKGSVHLHQKRGRKQGGRLSVCTRDLCQDVHSVETFQNRKPQPMLSWGGYAGSQNEGSRPKKPNRDPAPTRLGFDWIEAMRQPGGLIWLDSS